MGYLFVKAVILTTLIVIPVLVANKIFSNMGKTTKLDGGILVVVLIGATVLGIAAKWVSDKVRPPNKPRKN